MAASLTVAQEQPATTPLTGVELASHAQRICAPAKWRVWREGEHVRFEVLR